MTTGEPTGPETWVDRHGDALFRFALLRVGNRERAEDIVQECLTAALTARRRVSTGATERTWLIGILKHKIVDFHRRRARESPAELLPESAVDGDGPFNSKGFWTLTPGRWRSDPQALAADGEFREAVLRCIAELPPAQAAAFSLREIEQKSAREVCEILNLSPSNLWTLMHRARTRLRDGLDKQWHRRK